MYVCMYSQPRDPSRQIAGRDLELERASCHPFMHVRISELRFKTFLKIEMCHIP